MNNLFGNKYRLTDAEAKENAASGVRYLLYMVLAAVVIITAAHAIMLVLNQAAAFDSGEGLFGAILKGIRIAFPIIVEAAAVVAAVGFIKSQWRGGQKAVGFAIELVWFIFAAANMITLFAIERGQELQGWQSSWIQYGLPLSALIAGVLAYALVRSDPEHKRANERALAEELAAANEFNAYQDARISPAMLLIQKRRAFRDVVRQLETQGYDAEEIALMTQYVPDLAADHSRPVTVPSDRPSLTARVRDALGFGNPPEGSPVAMEMTQEQVFAYLQQNPDAAERFFGPDAEDAGATG